MLQQETVPRPLQVHVSYRALLRISESLIKLMARYALLKECKFYMRSWLG